MFVSEINISYPKQITVIQRKQVVLRSLPTSRLIYGFTLVTGFSPTRCGFHRNVLAVR